MLPVSLLRYESNNLRIKFYAGVPCPDRGWPVIDTRHCGGALFQKGASGKSLEKPYPLGEI
jgi:hypothetical protein